MGGKTFEWDSHVDTEHSKATMQRPQIAISIYTPEGEGTIQFGFYAQATVERVTEPNEHGIAHYQAIVTRSWINDSSYIKREVEM